MDRSFLTLYDSVFLVYIPTPPLELVVLFLVLNSSEWYPLRLHSPVNILHSSVIPRMSNKPSPSEVFSIRFLNSSK